MINVAVHAQRTDDREGGPSLRCAPVQRSSRLTPIRIAWAAAQFAVIVTVTGSLVACNNSATAHDENAPAEIQRKTVVVVPAQRATFERALVVQGNVQAKNFSVISPRIAGTLEAVFVDEGDTVEAGVTPLFQTDSVRLAKVVEVREHEVAVAEQSLREKQAAEEKAQSDYDKAEYDWERYQNLYQQGVSSTDELEDARAQHRGCAAMLKHAHALVDLAEAQLAQARSSLAIAHKDLDDSLFLAPISGRVTARYQEPGESGDPGQPVLRIEDPSVLEVSVFLPAQSYGEVIPDTTTMHTVVAGIDLGQPVVSYKSPTIDRTLRTFEARCILHDPPAAVASGALAQVRVVLERREGLGVPRDAIQRRDNGTVIFTVQDEQAHLIPVQTRLETNGLIEVLSDELRPDAPVVTIGSYFLNAGTPVQIRAEAH